MSHHTLNMDKMRSLSDDKQITTKKLYRLNIDNFKKKLATNLNHKQSTIASNFCPNNHLTLFRIQNVLYIFIFFKNSVI